MLKPTHFVLAFQDPDMYSGQVRDALLHTAVGIVIAILLVATGVACLVLYQRRGRTKDPALRWFGVFLILYGLRNEDLLRIVTFLAYPVPAIVWAYFGATITHVLAVPFLLFLREIFSTWRRTLGWLLWAQVPIIAASLVADIALHRPYAFQRLQSILTLLLFVSLVVAVFTLSQRTLSTRSLRIGLIIFSVTVVAQNLTSFGIIKFPFNPEPIGFAIFMLTLGSLISNRAIENQQRLIALDRELDIARQIQASILPGNLPRTDRLQIAARYLPMTAVAGDFYDVLVVDEQKVGILIADVSGHGVPAALIASMVKVAIASQLPHAHDPAMVLAGINQTLCGKLSAQFVTAAYLFLDLESNMLRYAAAGHPAIFWQQSRNAEIAAVDIAKIDIARIEENGLPLGILNMAAYTYTERPLNGGSRFLLYTDGLLEAAAPDGEFFAEQRIEAALTHSALLDPEQTATAILDRLKEWVGAKAFAQQEDDLTVLVVDVR